MERIEQLINKLAEQKNRGESPAQLLITVQLLHAELAAGLKNEVAKSKSKVAVLMPVHVGNVQQVVEQEKEAMPSKEATPPEEAVKPAVTSIPEKDKRFIPAEPAPVAAEISEPEPVKQAPEPARAIAASAYTLQKPPAEVAEKGWTEPEPEPKEVYSLSFDGMHEAPTLLQHAVAEKELHELIAEKKESLNDKLKQEKLELGNTLKEAPIKDLRKGIGVNDKFLFINELFRGDDAMYERSIKTINGFRILPEAEYWMNRELKVKLGWNDSKETVQLFYGIVRRRFS